MKRALLATSLTFAACSSFGAEDPPATMDGGSIDAGSPDAGETNAGDAGSSKDGDAIAAGFCDQTIACDQFEGENLDGWTGYGGDRYQSVPTKPPGGLSSVLPGDPLETAKDGTDSARIQRSLLADTAMRIEFDVTFVPLFDLHGHNVQLFSIATGSAGNYEYIGLYLSAQSETVGNLIVTAATESSGPDAVDTGTLTYNQPTHVTIDVRFGAAGGVRLTGLGAKGNLYSFNSSPGAKPLMTLGLARQNGGTDPLKATYDNFRATTIANF